MLLVNTISAAERAAGISREEPQPVEDEAGLVENEAEPTA
jgi:hypothetical protein